MQKIKNYHKNFKTFHLSQATPGLNVKVKYNIWENSKLKIITKFPNPFHPLRAAADFNFKAKYYAPEIQ